MTRTEFEDFLLRLVWRTGDTGLAADVQYLIRMGEARLSRDLKIQRRIKRAQIADADDYRLVLPEDYHSLRTLSDEACAYSYVSPWDLETKRIAKAGAGYYTIADTVEVGDHLLAADNTKTFDITYYAVLPDYTDAETWLQQHYYDLYLHACLIHTAPYLREDDRLQQWLLLYEQNLTSAMHEDAYRKYDGSPLRPRLPGVVA